MSNLNQLELQHIRHMVGAHGTIVNKLESLSQQCNDPQIQQMLKGDAQDAKNNKEKLMTFLN
ncbi:MAG: hypothetical protein GX366_05410 [Epulopiscium sp.]|nr:hypothetical protein [Candidatus Epulonipiscium sp.]